MFVLPFLPDWLFEGPWTIKHRPRRYICGECGAPWADDHADMAARHCRGTSFADRIVERRRGAFTGTRRGPRLQGASGPVLVFSRHEWTAFVGGVQAGEFDQWA
jgi:hypothetical protein